MVAEVRASQLYLAARAKFAKDGDVIADVRLDMFGDSPPPERASVPSGFSAAASSGMIETD